METFKVAVLEGEKKIVFHRAHRKENQMINKY